MAEFTWIKTSLVVILLLPFTAVIGEHQNFSVARVGEEVTLPCENVLKDHHRCDSTTWITNPREKKTTKELVNLGQIRKNEISKDKSDRLNVTAGCSLVITNVTVEDVGRYTCRQFNKTGKQQGPDDPVYLSVINLEEHQTNDLVRLVCSVLTYEGCGYSVKWLHDDDDKSNVMLTPHACGASVEFKTAHHKHKSNVYDSLKCSVTDQRSGRTFLYEVDPESSSGIKPTGGQKTPSAGDSTAEPWKWWHIAVAVCLAALLLLIFVLAIRWRKTKGNKTQMDENIKQTLNPALTQSAPETSQDMADPEDCISYASISYTKKSSSNAQVCGKDDNDEGAGAVTYSTVKARSSCAGASAELNSLYATINKPN
uniref:uncharacterized protein LOC124050341 isoform X2 n=1 Tax=Scatophagus argus TaxID=75038 RepID=UPI001ED841D7|nr:uncharacterized protein LOC124050341 isoform X2 [Scatophagus argus]